MSQEIRWNSEQARRISAEALSAAAIAMDSERVLKRCLLTISAVAGQGSRLLSEKAGDMEKLIQGLHTRVEALRRFGTAVENADAAMERANRVLCGKSVGQEHSLADVFETPKVVGLPPEPPRVTPVSVSVRSMAGREPLLWPSWFQ